MVSVTNEQGIGKIWHLVGLQAANALKRIVPMFDRVLIQRAEAATKSKGGILIPEKAQSKVREGVVVAAGTGARNEANGQIMPLSVQVKRLSPPSILAIFLKVGDKVLLPEFGGSKIEIEDQEFFLFKEQELVAKIQN